MPLRSTLLFASLTLVVPATAWGDGPPALDALPTFSLEGRVPPGWLTGRDDRMPLHPERWRKRVPRRCRTRGGYRRFCQGKRVVPEPHGPAKALAERLSLGKRATALALIHRRPFEAWVHATRGLEDARDLLWPVPEGKLTRRFGHIRQKALRHRRHNGLDIHAEPGAAIVAARDGLVAYSDNGLTGFGNVVILIHPDASTTLYAHCRATRVFAGQRVRRGDHIADVGSTGFTTAPHLHFEFRRRGHPVNPLRLMTGRPRWSGADPGLGPLAYAY